jgi:hypothetical protein
MEERKSFLLRMDPKLWRELEAWAQEELRSVNGQIEYVLKSAVQQRKKRVMDNDQGQMTEEQGMSKVQSPKSQA